MAFNPDHKFPWKIEEVETIASSFFDKAPDKMSNRDKWAWAAREAVNYLNARRNACEKALERDKAISVHYNNLRHLVEEREKLPVEWPYEKAVKYITGEDGRFGFSNPVSPKLRTGWRAKERPAMNRVAEAKARLPLPELMSRCGLGDRARKSARCPFHDDLHNSFSVWEN